jgi:hypothetical protein
MIATWSKALATAVLVSLAFAGHAVASPAWRLDSASNTTVAPGGTLDYAVEAANVGDQATDTSDIVFTATLPIGITAVDASIGGPNSVSSYSCTAGDGSSPVAGASDVRCVDNDSVPPFGSGLSINNFQEMDLTVAVDSGVSGTLTSSFAVSGGGAPDPATTVDPVVVASEPPSFGFDAADAQFTDAAGNPSTQAGAHPDAATFSFDFETGTDPLEGPLWPPEPVKDITVDLPPGLVGNPTVADQCTAQQLASAAGIEVMPLCPASSQIGTTMVRMNTHDTFRTRFYGPLPVFNMVPPPGAPARFGFNALGSVVTLDAGVRTGGDYGLTVRARNVPEGIALVGTTMTLWGVPASPSHDPLRGCPGKDPPVFGGPICGSGKPLQAFLRNPTSCTAPGAGLPFTASIDSWFHPGVFEDVTWFSHLLPGYPYAPEDWGAESGTEGCERVPFDAALAGTPAVPQAASPSSVSFDLTVPQSDDPALIGEADVLRATVTLPAGVQVSPSSAEGLAACSPAQIGLHDASAPTCPDASKIGSVTVQTPLLHEPLDGAVYLAAPHDNPFGTLLSLYVVAQGEGVVVKLAGRVDANPVTGQLTTTFDENPQLPFSDLHLELKGGPRAPLSMPRACGRYTTHAELIGWNGSIVNSESTFTVSGDGHGGICPPAQFTPGFTAETTRPVAGKASTFNLALSRDDVDERLAAVTVHLATGLTAKIANATLCGEPAAAHGACGAASKIGDVTVGAGAGPNPFYIRNGRAYITGPYKGAPFGLSIVVPAVAGPFDLGDVNVRSALFIDKHDASARVVSDPLPTILQGIPLDVRDVRVSVDRPNFFLNPTSCARKRIEGVIDSTAGSKAKVSSPFQVSECANLRFKPRMVLTVGGRGHTAKNRTTPLVTRLTMPARGQANLRFVRVTLPDSINARLTVINDACTRAEFESDAAAKCAHAQAGTATAVTPLLRDPLRGNVYFVKNGHPLPDLFVALRGQVDFDLIGRITIPHSRFLRTTFAAAPDVPVRSFRLRLFGDRRNGSVGAAVNLCSAAARHAKVQLDYIGHNGRVRQLNQRLRVRGCSKHSVRRHRRGH